ncbi:MAG: energy transducer TonB [Sphingomonas bacterium]|jgi:protein TonB|nr:energy transducer TonB [Sphingomonas bacterium]
MAYVDQSMGKEKTVAATITAIILIVVGYAFYTGLAFNIIKKAAKDLNVIDIQDKPPPPPKTPPPPPKVERVTAPPIVAPPPLVQAPSPPVNVMPTVSVAPPPAPLVITPRAPVAPPAPSQASGLKPRGDPAGWASSDDYPPGALRNEEQGSTGIVLAVGPDGKPTGCTVSRSSGFPDLDDVTCKLMMRRARFTPAKDAAGNGLATTWPKSIRWQIPKD